MIDIFAIIQCQNGMILIQALVLLILGISLYKKRSQKYGFYYLLLFAIILFYAFMETILFTYRFWPMMIAYVILFYGANTESREEANLI